MSSPMRTSSKLRYFLLIALLSSLFHIAAQPAEPKEAARFDEDGLSNSSTADASALPGSGGIKEEIPDKFRARYEGWKRECLLTETGRRQWEMYARNEGFTLTI